MTPGTPDPGCKPMSQAIRMHPEGLPAAVLWDMDGTLVDTEPDWIAAEWAAVDRWGGSWSEEQSQFLIGSDLNDAAQVLIEAGMDADPLEIVHFLVGHVADRVRRQTEWRPGARELIAQLTGLGVPQALVTMSWTELSDAVLDQLPTGTFDSIVTGDRVSRGKPHPDPYLLACAELGVTPEGCVAIEDSPTGVASAQAAGVWTIAVPNLRPIDPAPGRRVLSTLAGLTPADLLTRH